MTLLQQFSKLEVCVQQYLHVRHNAAATMSTNKKKLNQSNQQHTLVVFVLVTNDSVFSNELVQKMIQ